MLTLLGSQVHGVYPTNYPLRNMEKLQIVFQLPSGESMKLKAIAYSHNLIPKRNPGNDMSDVLERFYQFDLVTFSGNNLKLSAKKKVGKRSWREITYFNEISVESSWFQDIKIEISTNQERYTVEHINDYKV